MRATRALLGKELRQHGAALVALSALLALAWFAARVTFEKNARVLSALELVATFARGPLAVAALYLGQRLVVAEQYGRTQRFVEALPIRRGHFDLLKAAFGLAWLELWALAALAAGASAAAGHEPVGGRFLGVMAMRLGAYVVALWGVVFLLGFFGRLRLILSVALAVFVFLLDKYTVFQVERFGPFALTAQETFAFERRHVPALAVAQSLALGLGAVAIAWGLRRVREGSIVESLARRLSPREIYALMIVGLGATLAFSALARDRPPAPYALTTDRVLRSTRVPLEIAYLEDDLRRPAERLLADLEPTLLALGDALRFPVVRPVRVVHAPDLPVDRPRTVQRHQTEGVVLRANLALPHDHPTTDVVSFVIHELLWAHTRGRAGLEARHWLLDGFALHFALHGGKASGEPLASRELDRWTLRALVANELLPLGAEMLRTYHQTGERLGYPLANGLAASGWAVLESRVGRERALALARAAFGRAGTGDVRDFLHDWRHPLPELLARETGLSFEAFLDEWARTLAALRARPAAAEALGSLPRGPVEVRVGHELAVHATAAPAPAAPLSCQVLHQRLPPYDLPVDDEQLERIEVVWGAGRGEIDAPVHASYGSGERAFVTFECELPALATAARLGTWRVTQP